MDMPSRPSLQVHDMQATEPPLLTVIRQFIRIYILEDPSKEVELHSNDQEPLAHHFIRHLERPFATKGCCVGTGMLEIMNDSPRSHPPMCTAPPTFICLSWPPLP